MVVEKQFISRKKTTYFSEMANQLTENQKVLSGFIQFPFSLEAFGQQIELKEKSYSAENREVLYHVISKQLSPYFRFTRVKENVELLKEKNTFTITTGHQLNLYGGPLYLVYKIMDALRLTERLKEEYPSYNFVPVFWTASEDHDFAEINHLRLFNDTFSWDSSQKGAVGRFSLDGIEAFKEELKSKFQNNPSAVQFLEQFYTKESLSSATVEFLIELVGEYGIIVVDADNADLKSMFAPLMRKELTEQFSVGEIEKSTIKLEDEGYFGQAFARPINLFYLDDNSRERIIPAKNNDFKIGDKVISKEEILEELDSNPERFSPNVVFRPLYQECILPNLCYLGGGGEMAYWLQLKGMFDQTNIPFPLIKVRNSIQWFDAGTTKKLNKLELTYHDVFEDIDTLKKRFVLEESGEEMDFSQLDKKTNEFTQLLLDTVCSVDKGLEGYAKAECARIEKQLSALKSKLIRHQKSKFEIALQQIDGIYDRLFPNRGLQERTETIIPFMARYGTKEFIKTVYDLVDPFENRLILAIEK